MPLVVEPEGAPSHDPDQAPVSVHSPPTPPMAGTRTDAAAPPLRRRVPWWWKPRVRAGLLLVALGIISAVARVISQFQTEWLWYHELGQERVFWTILATKW